MKKFLRLMSFMLIASMVGIVLCSCSLIEGAGLLLGTDEIKAAIAINRMNKNEANADSYTIIQDINSELYIGESVIKMMSSGSVKTQGIQSESDYAEISDVTVTIEADGDRVSNDKSVSGYYGGYLLETVDGGKYKMQMSKDEYLAYKEGKEDDANELLNNTDLSEGTLSFDDETRTIGVTDMPKEFVMDFIDAMSLQSMYESLGWRITDASVEISISLDEEFYADKTTIRIEILGSESIDGDIISAKPGNVSYFEIVADTSDWNCTVVDEHRISDYKEMDNLDKLVEIKNFLMDVERLENGSFTHTADFDLTLNDTPAYSYVETDDVKYWRDEDGRLKYRIDGVISGPSYDEDITLSLEYADGVASSEYNGEIDTMELTDMEAVSLLLSQYEIFVLFDINGIRSVKEIERDGYMLYEIELSRVDTSSVQSLLTQSGAGTISELELSGKILVKMVDGEPVSIDYDMEVSGYAHFSSTRMSYGVKNSALLVFGEAPVVDNGGSGSDAGAA